MQGTRCAYCERMTDDSDQRHGHIEHFREQKHFPSLALDWNNLFWSCSDPLTCGERKGICVDYHGSAALFDPNCLIDPSKDDPDVYLLFASDGTVHPRTELSPVGRHRAEETIRVFQLNASSYLRRGRQEVVNKYIRFAGAIAAYGSDALRSYVASELAHTQDACFSTAIKQFLTSVTP